MEQQDDPQPDPGDRGWDGLVEELRRLRRSAGEPSYTEIAQRVTERREARGATPYSARVARSTVYDAFRTGRSRVNIPLVRDIAATLGASDADVDSWLRQRSEPAPPVTPPSSPPPSPPVSPPVTPPVEPLADVRSAGPGAWPASLLLLGCLLLNLLGRGFVELLDLPLHLDMVGTAIAAIALGPWRGALVGGATNLVGYALSGPVSLPFAVVNVVGALIWGYGVRRWGLGRTLPRFFALNVLVAVASTALAVVITTVVLGGTVGRAETTIIDDVTELTRTFWLAFSLSNLLVSLADKTISGFVALVSISVLPAALRRGLPLVLGHQDRAPERL